MDIDIRAHIQKNFNDSAKDEIKATIIASIEEKDDITLPGMGVFFELLWQNSDENSQEYILNTLEKSFSVEKVQKMQKKG